MLLVPAMNGWLLALGCLAVAGSISLEVWRRLESRAQSERQSATREEAKVVFETLSKRLENPEDCTALLGGETLQTSARVEAWLNYELPESENLNLASLQLETPADDDFRTEIEDENGIMVELRRYRVRVWASLVDKEGVTVELRRAEPLYVWSTPPPPIGNGQIQSCFGAASAAAICNDLGGYFIPQSEPYQESCRHSLKTLRRVGAVLSPIANCRIGAVADSPQKCSKYGLHFGTTQLNAHAKVLPIPGNKYLCQICQ